MSLRKILSRVLGGSFATIVALGSLTQNAHAQAQPPDPMHPPTLYVAPGGTYNVPRDTGHPSTDALNNPNRPYDSITHACQNALPNDTIEVAPGTYADTSSSPTAAIVFKSNLTIRPPLPFDPNNRPKLTGGPGQNFTVVKFDGCDHILFYGFEVDGSTSGPQTSGIVMEPRFNTDPSINSEVRTHDIQIKYCKVHDASNGGIITNGDVSRSYGYGCDYIQITGNEIYNCLSLGTSGSSAISLHNDLDVDSPKNTGFHSTIQNNIVHDNVNQNRDLDANGNIDVKKHTDGNGIIIDTTGFQGPRIVVQNNLVYRNGGRGIHVFQSSNVTVLNNTVYGNNLDPYIQTNGPAELSAGTCSNVLFSNNVVQGNGLAPAFAVGLVYGQTNGTITFKNTTYTGCASLPPASSRDHDRTNAAIDWASTIFSDPAWGSLFVNSSTGDFHLRTLATRAPLTSAQSQTTLNRGSSAAGEFSSASIEGVMRPVGGAVDRGAYEQ